MRKAFALRCAVASPLHIHVVRDSDTADERHVLEQYFQDLHRIFLMRFREFSDSSLATDTDARQLQSMLSELIRLKSKLGK
jgi:hypothetical protein